MANENQQFEEVSIALNDGYQSYGRFWHCEKSTGAVLLHNGIQSHCGWFERTAGLLTSAGLCVLQVDRRGTGRNTHSRGHAESADQLVDDANVAAEYLRERTGYSKIHIAGISWGGRLAIVQHIHYPEITKSLCLITPGLFPLVGASKEQVSQIGFAMIYEQEKLFDIPLNVPELLTSNEKMQEWIRQDEYGLKQATAGFYLASRRMDKMFRKFIESKQVPLMLMMAGDEQIVDNEKTHTFVKELNWPGSVIKEYAGSRHTLEYEPDADQYLADLSAFYQSAT